MKGRNLLCVSVVLALAVAFAGAVVAADAKKLDVKVGEEYYVCNCGEGCPCDTISSKTGQCGCGQDLVKAKVTKVEGDKAMFKAEKWAKEVEFDLVAKYTCACGPDCPCKTISQKPGKCGCGKDLKQIGG